MDLVTTPNSAPSSLHERPRPPHTPARKAPCQASPATHSPSIALHPPSAPNPPPQSAATFHIGAGLSPSCVARHLIRRIAPAMYVGDCCPRVGRHRTPYISSLWSVLTGWLGNSPVSTEVVLNPTTVIIFDYLARENGFSWRETSGLLRSLPSLLC